MKVESVNVFVLDWDAIGHGHHYWCDGWMGVHEPTATESPNGLWVAACTKGCAIDVVGMAGSSQTARSIAAKSDHEWGREKWCSGDCWDFFTRRYLFQRQLPRSV